MVDDGVVRRCFSIVGGQKGSSLLPSEVVSTDGATVDVHRRIAVNVGVSASAVDVPANSNVTLIVVWYDVTNREMLRHDVCVVSNVDLRVGFNRGRSTQAAAIDRATDTLSFVVDMNHVDHWGPFVGFLGGDGGYVAAAIDVGDSEWTIDRFFDHVHCDNAFDVAVLVAAAEGRPNGTTVEVQGDVAAFSC